jgi:Flp pilus assembly protein TadB
LIVYALGYSFLCLGILLAVVMITNIQFKGVIVHRRVKEMRHYLEVSDSKRVVLQEEEAKGQKKIVDQIDEWLEWCNYPFGLTASLFMMLFMIYIVVGLGGFIILLVHTDFYHSIMTQSTVGAFLLWAAVLLVAIIMITMPLSLLKSMAAKSQRKLQKQFLYMLNYFQVFLKTGIMPMDVIKEVIKFIPNPLQKRLIQLFAEIQVYNEKEGFIRFATRLQFNESEQFKNAILDSIEIGSDASEVCQNLAKEMRDKHKNEIISQIKKKPFFILLPKICFVIAILIIIVLPVLDKIFRITTI